jgi:hypothetical protein
MGRAYVPPMTSTFAYLDPGSAGILLQMLGGGVAALAVAIKLFWRRILTFLHLRADDPEAEPASEPDAR